MLRKKNRIVIPPTIRYYRFQNKSLFLQIAPYFLHNPCLPRLLRCHLPQQSWSFAYPVVRHVAQKRGWFCFVKITHPQILQFSFCAICRKALMQQPYTRGKGHSSFLWPTSDSLPASLGAVSSISSGSGSLQLSLSTSLSHLRRASFVSSASKLITYKMRFEETRQAAQYNIQ